MATLIFGDVPSCVQYLPTNFEGVRFSREIYKIVGSGLCPDRVSGSAQSGRAMFFDLSRAANLFDFLCKTLPRKPYMLAFISNNFQVNRSSVEISKFSGPVGCQF